MDICLADRGFNIQELLVPFQVKLIIPPFLKKKKQPDVDDAVKTKQVANSRIHVERVIGRIKEFQIERSRDALSEEVRCLGGASIWPILAGILQYKVTKVG